MLKKLSKLERIVGDRSYQFFCEEDSPIGEVYDALCVMKSFISNIILNNEGVREAEQEKNQACNTCKEVVDE